MSIYTRTCMFMPHTRMSSSEDKGLGSYMRSILTPVWSRVSLKWSSARSASYQIERWIHKTTSARHANFKCQLEGRTVPTWLSFGFAPFTSAACSSWDRKQDIEVRMRAHATIRMPYMGTRDALSTPPASPLPLPLSTQRPKLTLAKRSLRSAKPRGRTMGSTTHGPPSRGAMEGGKPCWKIQKLKTDL